MTSVKGLVAKRLKKQADSEKEEKKEGVIKQRTGLSDCVLWNIKRVHIHTGRRNTTNFDCLAQCMYDASG